MAGVHPRPKLLLPLSGGVSSLVLLEVLDKQVRRQREQQGRTAYEVVVCHVQMAGHGREMQSEKDDEVEEWWTRRLRARFGSHTFVPLAQLHEVFESGEHGESLDEALQVLGVDYPSSSTENGHEALRRLLTSATTATSRADLTTILLRRMIVRIARQNGCSAILWGHSDTQLAAQTLSAVAKGRGASVAGELADGPAASAPGLAFNYPVRELYKHELRGYVDTLGDELGILVVEDESLGAAPVSLKQTSIEQLLGVYVREQGEKYPGIMANVVKTAGKLDLSGQAGAGRCVLCMGFMVDEGRETRLCYGCERLKQDIKAG